MTRILVVDDHPVTREGIRLAICARRADCVVDICPDIANARAHLRDRHRYDLILLDYRLPDSQGLSGFFTIQSVAGGIPIAILTASVSDRLAPVARAVGCVGYLSKADALPVIADSIERLLDGDTVFPRDDEIDPEMLDLRDRILGLSTAQLRVLTAVLNGALNKQIAADLDVTEATIKAHMTTIFRKLGVDSRVEAVRAVRPLFGDIE